MNQIDFMEIDEGCNRFQIFLPGYIEFNCSVIVTFLFQSMLKEISIDHKNFLQPGFI